MEASGGESGTAGAVVNVGGKINLRGKAATSKVGVKVECFEV